MNARADGGCGHACDCEHGRAAYMQAGHYLKTPSTLDYHDACSFSVVLAVAARFANAPCDQSYAAGVADTAAAAHAHNLSRVCHGS